MGKRGQRHPKKTSSDPVLEAALAAGSGGLFRALPPNKRHELNKLVERLLNLCSNFTEDAPSTPQGLYEEHLEIRKILTTVQELEQCNLNRRLMGSRKAHVALLNEWIEKHGGTVKGVKIEDYKEEGLGLKVTEDTEQGQVVMSIPRKVMMSVDTAKDSEIGRLIEKDRMLQSMNNVTLALHLLLEKTSPASFWEPYINTLPLTYNTVLYFDLDDFQFLRGSPAFEDALKQFKYVARQYAYFYRKFQGTILKDYFTFDEYRWAVSTVMTRQNQVPSLHDEGQPANTLIPFWDLANHANGVLSTDYDDETHSIKCMANSAFKAGDQFTIFYGVRGNHDLLVHNGFTYADNEHDFVSIRLGVSKNDPLYAAKIDLLAKLMMAPQSHFALKKEKGGGDGSPFDSTLLAFLRVLCLGVKEQVESWAEDEAKARGLLAEETEKELDVKAYQYLMTRCSLLLKSYPTTLEEDSVVARKRKPGEEGEDLSQIQKFCLVLRMGEKEILHQTIKYCQSKL